MTTQIYTRCDKRGDGARVVSYTVMAQATNTGEDLLLARVSVESLLALLDEKSRSFVELFYGLHMPHGYKGSWPPKAHEVGEYWGKEHLGRPITARAVRKRATSIEKQLKEASRRQLNAQR